MDNSQFNQISMDISFLYLLNHCNTPHSLSRKKEDEETEREVL